MAKARSAEEQKLWQTIHADKAKVVGFLRCFYQPGVKTIYQEFSEILDALITLEEKIYNERGKLGSLGPIKEGFKLVEQLVTRESDIDRLIEALPLLKLRDFYKASVKPFLRTAYEAMQQALDLHIDCHCLLIATRNQETSPLILYRGLKEAFELQEQLLEHLSGIQKNGALLKTLTYLHFIARKIHKSDSKTLASGKETLLPTEENVLEYREKINLLQAEASHEGLFHYYLTKVIVQRDYQDEAILRNKQEDNYNKAIAALDKALMHAMHLPVNAISVSNANKVLEVISLLMAYGSKLLEETYEQEQKKQFPLLRKTPGYLSMAAKQIDHYLQYLPKAAINKEGQYNIATMNIADVLERGMRANSRINKIITAASTFEEKSFWIQQAALLNAPMQKIADKFQEVLAQAPHVTTPVFRKNIELFSKAKASVAIMANVTKAQEARMEQESLQKQLAVKQEEAHQQSRARIANDRADALISEEEKRLTLQQEQAAKVQLARAVLEEARARRALRKLKEAEAAAQEKTAPTTTKPRNDEQLPSLSKEEEAAIKMDLQLLNSAKQATSLYVEGLQTKSSTKRWKLFNQALTGYQEAYKGFGDTNPWDRALMQWGMAQSNFALGEIECEHHSLLAIDYFLAATAHYNEIVKLLKAYKKDPAYDPLLEEKLLSRVKEDMGESRDQLHKLAKVIEHSAEAYKNVNDNRYYAKCRFGLLAVLEHKKDYPYLVKELEQEASAYSLIKQGKYHEAVRALPEELNRHLFAIGDRIWKENRHPKDTQGIPQKEVLFGLQVTPFYGEICHKAAEHLKEMENFLSPEKVSRLQPDRLSKEVIEMRKMLKRAHAKSSEFSYKGDGMQQGRM